MKVKILLIAFLSIVYLQANAQKSNDEVTLVVSATASTEDEAIKTALRSAIEQTYGTFVSANTTLLNDELVKDEIVTISSGNIKEYNKIKSYENTNGQISVVLKATVCISKLVTYAKNKGASTEFAGASFAMNMKMLELNKEAEEKALINLLLFIKESLPSAFDRNIQFIDPSIPRRFDFYDNGTGRVLLPCTYEPNYAENNNVSDDDMILNKEDINWAQNVAEKCYEISILISYANNKNTEPFFSYVKNYLKSISLTEDEREYLEKTGMDFTKYNFYTPDYDDYYYFRNGSDVIGSFTCQLAKIFDKYFFNFYVVDNLGGRSLVDYHTKMDTESIPKEDRFRNYSSGVLSPKSFFASSVYDYNETVFSLGKDPKIKLTFFIPKDKIAQYSSFTIE